MSFVSTVVAEKNDPAKSLRLHRPRVDEDLFSEDGSDLARGNQAMAEGPYHPAEPAAGHL
jgi:hypothetical protein